MVFLLEKEVANGFVIFYTQFFILE